MKIEGLWIYPVKSFRGIAVTEMEILTDGPRFDRQWMLVDAAGKFVTQRQHPKLATIQPQIDFAAADTAVRLRFSVEGRLFEIPGPSGHELPVKIWSHEGKALAVEGPWNEALSDFLESPVTLVTMSPHSPRLRDSKWPLHFPDTAQLLLVNRRSLTDLNSKIDSPIGMDRFRANILVTAERPWVEESWSRFDAGGARFIVRGPCARCVMITTDQDTGEVKSRQPLTVLASMKRTPASKADFGIHAMVEVPGRLRVGDELTHS